MKPVNFQFERPKYLADAIGLLSNTAHYAKAIAGGQSLGPLLNMRLVRPDLIVEIAALDELRHVEKHDSFVILGACVTHADIEDGRVPDVTHGILPAVAKNIAYRAVRNRGTLGGSLCAADPAADWLPALAALGAEVNLAGPLGARTMPVEAFVTGALETALETGELLQSVRVPAVSPDARWGYYKVSRKTGQHAYAIAAILLDRQRNVFRAAIGAAGGRPLVIPNARVLFGSSDDLRRFDADAAGAMLRSNGISDPLDEQILRAVLARASMQAAVT